MGVRIAANEYRREFFLSPHLEGYYEYCNGTLSSVKRKQLELLELELGAKVLEVGYGRGELLLHCARKGAEVIGVDYSLEACKIAQTTLNDVPQAKLLLANCLTLPFREAAFDRVFSGDVIEHLSYDDAVQMLREIYRVTKPGGMILIHTTPNIIFTRFVYPLARYTLRLFSPQTVRMVDAHLKVMKQLHVDEYDLFLFRKAAACAGLSGAKAWIDKDLLRSGEDQYTKAFSRGLVGLLLHWCSKVSLVRYFLGNDLYLQCVK